MKKLNYILFLIIIVFSFNVKAASSHCDSKELSRLKELASKIEFDYDYKIVNEKAEFSINAINLNKDLKVVIEDSYYLQSYKTFKADSNNRGTLTGFASGDKVAIKIYASVPNWCSGDLVSTKTISLPYYNPYYDKGLCETVPDFKYCKELVDKDLTESEFRTSLRNYIKNRSAETGTDNSKSNKDGSSIFIIIGIILAIIILAVTTVMNYKRIKKNSI